MGKAKWNAMVKFRDFFEKVQQKNFRIDNPIHSKEYNYGPAGLIEYINDMITDHNPNVKNELIIGLEQSRVFIMKRIGARKLSPITTNEIYDYFNVENGREIKNINKILSIAFNKMKKEVGTIIYSGAKDGKFEEGVEEAYKYVINSLGLLYNIEDLWVL
ncbi:MAG: hypothetical protein ACFFCM_22255 [Promethearchaeota archaeon]